MIEFPEMREELIDRIQLLVDRDYQQNRWGSKSPHLDFDYIISFLFDLPAIADDPFGYIGLALKNEQEAKFVRNICKSIEFLFERYDKDKTDLFYISTLEWDSVVQAAEDFWDYLRNIDESISKRGLLP